MKYTIALVLGFSLLTGGCDSVCDCVDPPEGTLKGTNVFVVDIPENAQVNEEVEIKLRVNGPTGCWENLQANLVTVKSRHFLIRGTGVDYAPEVCNALALHQDTTIIFIPNVPGEYYFQTNEDPFVIELDTLIVE
jgi:hypothetical protein